MSVTLPINPRVLVVSPNDGAREAVSEALAKAGFTTVLARDVAQVKAELDEVDGVVIDVEWREALAVCRGVRDVHGLLFPVVGFGRPAAGVEKVVKAGFDSIFAARDDLPILATRLLILVRASMLHIATAEKADALLRWQDWVRYLVHDIRNPLAAALGNVSHATSYVRDGDARDGLVESIAALKRASAMLQDLLDTSRLRRGILQLNRTKTDVEELARQAIADVAPLVSEALRPVLHASGEASIRCDATLVGRVFGNLISNAARYATSHPVEVTVVGSAERVFVRVLNDGPGIPPKVRDKLFEPWAAVEEASSASTGLGLAFCRLAVEAHGGSIWLESGEAGKVEFCFVIPRRE